MTAAETKRSWHLMTTYGITSAQYDALLLAQGGVCAICGKPPGARRLSVDHDHKTLLVRGLLCTPHCNLRIVGRVNDPGVFRAAAEYLSAPPAVAVIGLHRVPRNPPKRRKRRRKVAA